jgi:hypothetical protein
MRRFSINRRLVWGGVLVVSVTVLLAASFSSRYERVSQTVHVDASPEALRNPLLALERFLAVMGRSATILQSAHDLDGLPAGGVLILGAQRRAAMSAAHVASLVHWVEAGGHLIVDAETSDKDPLLDAFGLSTTGGAPIQPLAFRPAPVAPGAGTAPQKVDVLFREGDRTLTAQFHSTARSLKANKATPRWVAGTAKSVYLIELDRGAGAVTAVLSLSDILSNRSIGTADNAQVVWALVNAHNEHGPVRILWRVVIPTLWEWLVGTAPMVLVSAAVLLMLWLWSVVPRFGPVLGEPELARRSLAEHLRAMGRAVWRAKEDEGLRYWLYCTRRIVLSRAAVRDGTLLRQPVAEQARRIAARMAGKIAVSEQSVRIAIAGLDSSADRASVREGFTRLIAILQQIETSL